MPMLVVNAVVSGPTHAIARQWLAGQASEPLRSYLDQLADAAAAALSGPPAFTRNRQSRFFTLALPIAFLLIFATVFRSQTAAVPGGRISVSVYYVPGIRSPPSSRCATSSSRCRPPTIPTRPLPGSRAATS